MVAIAQKGRQAVQWLEPSPLWGGEPSWVRVPNQTMGEQPLILRFANDEFMEELMAMLNHSPWRLDEWIARPESWRKPMQSPEPILKTRAERNIANMYNKTKLVMQHQSIGTNTAVKASSLDLVKLSYDQSLNNHDPIKLYQPYHQRHYLVTASLTTNQSAYPDHLLDLTNQESASFVVRAVGLKPQPETSRETLSERAKRLVSQTEKQFQQPPVWHEYALVTTEFGLAWKDLGPYQLESADLQLLVPGEEKQPLFPVTYQNDCGHARQILAGTIPVGQRERWLAAPSAGDIDHSYVANPVLSNEGGITHIKEIFQSDVSEPWKAIIDQAQTQKTSIHADENTFPNAPFAWNADKAAIDEARALKTTRDQLQTGSWYVLLNFANFLEEYLPDIWEVLNGEKPEQSLHGKRKQFYQTIKETELSVDCYAQLAKENLAVSGFRIEPTIWDELKALYEIERYFNIQDWRRESEYILQEINGQIDTIYAAKQYHSDALEFRTAVGGYISNLTAQYNNAVHKGKYKQDLKDIIGHLLAVLQAIEASIDEYDQLAKQFLALGSQSSSSAFYQDLQQFYRFSPAFLAKIRDFYQVENLLEVNGSASHLQASLRYLRNFHNDLLEEIDEGFNSNNENLLTFHANAVNYHEDALEEVNDRIRSIDGMVKILGDISGNPEIVEKSQLTTSFQILLDKLSTTEWFTISEVKRYVEQAAPDINELRAFVLGDNSFGEFSLSADNQIFYDSLSAISVDQSLVDAISVNGVAEHGVTIVTTLQDALVAVKQHELQYPKKEGKGLEMVTSPFERQSLSADDTRSVPVDENWPHFLFPLADPSNSLSLQNSVVLPAFTTVMTDDMSEQDLLEARLDQMAEEVDQLVSKEGLSSRATGQLNQESLFKQYPLLDPRNTRFIVRCVFEKPNCGPLYPPVVSKASCQLEFAAFFDPDAPGRPIRIPMPLDISPAGLRKYKKNTMFLISDMLCGKMKKLRKLTFADLVLSVLPWPFHKDLPNPSPSGTCGPKDKGSGMYCSLSIPIVTLCALILLMVMVKLFDIFFKWIPYLFVCLPIPGLKGK